VIQFDEPLTNEAQHRAQQHRERRGLQFDEDSSAGASQLLSAVEPEADFFAILQRRIEAQRSELQQHRADIKTAIEQDVQYVGSLAQR
jgi:hypothetical protein